MVLLLNATCPWRQPRGFVRDATGQEWRPEQKCVEILERETIFLSWEKKQAVYKQIE